MMYLSLFLTDDVQNVLLMTNDTVLEDSVFASPSAVAGQPTATLLDPLGSAPIAKQSSDDSGIAQSGSVDLLCDNATSERCVPVTVNRDTEAVVEQLNIETDMKNVCVSGENGGGDNAGCVLSTVMLPAGRVSDPFSPIQENLPSPLLSSPPQAEFNDTTPMNTPHSSITGITPDSSHKSDHSGASSHTLQCDEPSIVGQDSATSTQHKPLPPNNDDSLLLEDSLVSFETSTPVSDDNSPNKSLTSPVHSIRTPVTENDPLGLFVPPTLSTVASAPVLAGKLHEHLNHGVSNGSLDSPQTKVSSRDMLIDLQPFSNTSTPVRRLWADQDRAKSGLSSSGASSPGSPLESWSPLSSQTHGQPSLAGVGEIGQANHTPTSARKKASTLPVMGAAPALNLYGSQDAEHGTPRRTGKTPSRSESFGTAFRSVTSRMATKFTELKQTMGTPSKGQLGSSGSLHRSDRDRMITEEDEESHMRKAGSLDFLGQGDQVGLPPHLTPKPAISSLEDVRGTPTTKGKLAMPGLFNKGGSDDIQWSIFWVLWFCHNGKLKSYILVYGVL